MSAKLYQIKNGLGIYYVVAFNPTQAEEMLYSHLIKTQFSGSKELTDTENIKVIANAPDYLGQPHRHLIIK